MKSLLPIIAAAVVAPMACSCPSDTKPERPEMPKDLRQDVRKACEHQKAWPKRIYKECTQCESGSSAPACGCPADQRAYSGKCYQQVLAKRDETSCEEVFKCTHKCKSTECECFTACYEGHELCSKLAGELEGCIAEICDPFCR